LGIPLGGDFGRDSLPFGGYTVLIQNISNPTCLDSVHLIIQNLDGPDATAMTTAASCGQADGTAILSPDTLNYIWEDNSTDIQRTDLTAGVYFVTVTNPAAPTCPNVILVTVDENNTLAATLTINQIPDCGISNGEATINVTGGSGNYSYSWDSGVATSTNLASGVYEVTITDLAAPDCELVYIFALTDNVPPATYSKL